MLINCSIFIFFIMRAMGEMLYYGARQAHLRHFGSISIIHATSWLYDSVGSNWFQWVIVGMSEIIAVGAYMQYCSRIYQAWIPGINCNGFLGAANLIFC
ncbi:hypothetical protein CW304_10625 [Bacillus sp. UFRGS-B20]|nr:hypothetical protein CW304_10625 [Bacillus sp. UFRGS-B20]